MCQKRNKLSEQILYCLSELSKICPAISVQSIRAKTQAANSKLFNHLHQIKAQKLDQPIGPQITSDSWPENLKTAVTIPENLLLSDSEKSFLSMGFNFVPALAKKMILTSRTKILSKHFRFESLNGIPQRAWKPHHSRNVSFQPLHGGQFTLSTQLIILHYSVVQFTHVEDLRKATSHWCINIWAGDAEKTCK